MSDTNSGIQKIDEVSYAREPLKKNELGSFAIGVSTQMKHFPGSITNARAPNHLC